jgi:hypothetical protein
MGGYGTEEFAARWRQLTFAEQMGNIGSEFDRVISWRKRNKPESAERAFDRMLELLDLTIADPRWRGPKLKELTRAREFICDLLVGDNTYNFTPEYFSEYFLQFAIAARKDR